MQVWEYAFFYDVANGNDGVRFTRDHPVQHAFLAA